MSRILDFVSGPRTKFVKWALVNAIYGAILAAAALEYHGHVHSIGLIAIGAVLVLFLLASGFAGLLAWTRGGANLAIVDDHTKVLTLAIELAPKLAMLGTVGGFLIAFSSGAGDVQGRVLGASTGLAATFVGIFTMVALEIIRHIVED